MHKDLVLGGVLAGILIFFTLLYVYLFRPNDAQAADQPITILVQNGGYQPSLIEIPKGKPTKIRFIRSSQSDTTPCTTAVIFPQFHIAYPLPVQQPVDIIIPALEASEIDFTCQSAQFHGKILIV